MVKSWILEKLQHAGLVDNKDIVFRTALVEKQTKKQVAGEIAKQVASALFLGFYETSEPVPYIAALNGDKLHLIELSNVRKKSTAEDIIKNTFTLSKENVEQTIVEPKKFYTTLNLVLGEQTLMIYFLKKTKPYLEPVMQAFNNNQQLT